MTLPDLIRWARHEYQLETPPLALHEGPDHIGEGGAPKWTGAFTHYVTAPPWAVDPHDPTWYETPFRLAVVKLARYNPLSASICFLIAQGEFTSSTAVAYVAPLVPPEFRSYIVLGALRKLRSIYREQTPIPEQGDSWVDLSESQQNAVLQGEAGTARITSAE